ncbi:MAG TPA: hypothetical protein VK162_00900 [Streptosporangiaceae bacterium]|nr:hypothetical protein [Streptosporangiaceae bacterium]
MEVGWIEAGESVPQSEIRRRGVLRLQSDDAADGIDHVHRFAMQQHLPVERGPVELPGNYAQTSPDGSSAQHAESGGAAG